MPHSAPAGQKKEVNLLILAGFYEKAVCAVLVCEKFTTH